MVQFDIVTKLVEFLHFCVWQHWPLNTFLTLMNQANCKVKFLMNILKADINYFQLTKTMEIRSLTRFLHLWLSA